MCVLLYYWGNKTIMIMVIVESPTSAQMPVIWHHFVVRLTVLLVRNSNRDREQTVTAGSKSHFDQCQIKVRVMLLMLQS